MNTYYSFGSSVKNASKYRKRITDQLGRLQNVLEDVHDRLVWDERVKDMDEGVQHGAAKATFQLQALVRLLKDDKGLDRCRGELESFKAKLESNGGRHLQITQALIWPFKKSDVNKTLDHLA